jgi:5-oxoprolinase (ATP-hydrolysing) subunit A
LPRIDLNCDMGESFGAYKLGGDEELMKSITSANIACGWHAGDPAVMNRTVQMAAAHDVGIGAHPGYPDLLGFGRRYMDCAADEIRNFVIYQVGALMGFCSANGVQMQHVKAHGALYNVSVDKEEIATAIAKGIASVDSELFWVVLAGPKSAALAEIGASVGIRVVFEAFADRAYTAQGTLVPRRQPGAVIKDSQQVARRALKMASEGKVTAVDESEIDLVAQTICVHGDTPGAVEIVQAIRGLLESEGVEIKPMAASA